MSKHLHRDLERLKREILAMGSLVEEATRDALQALLENREEIAHRVIRGDDRVDQKELEVEEECLKILALHQPVAADLRFIIAVLKVNNDLERIADIAKNIAKRSRDMARAKPIEAPKELEVLAEKTRGMVTRSLDALVNLDSVAARVVCEDDAEIDRLQKQLFGMLQDRMMRDSAEIPSLVSLLSVSRYLERIGDLATNIAEDVVFTVEGEVIRHGGLGDPDSTITPRPDLRVVTPGHGPGSGGSGERGAP